MATSNLNKMSVEELLRSRPKKSAKWSLSPEQGARLLKFRRLREEKQEKLALNRGDYE